MSMAIKSDKLLVRCNKCGKEHWTRLFEIGDLHLYGGEFEIVGKEDQ